jgi:glycosyltransferase involved in cell wall biosynthesis
MNHPQSAQRRLIYASQFIDDLVEMRTQFLLCKGFVDAGWEVELRTLAGAIPQQQTRAWGTVPIEVMTGSSRFARLLKLSLFVLLRKRTHFVLSWVWDWHGYALALARRLAGSPYAVLLDSYPHRASYHGESIFTLVRLELRYGFVLRNADVIIAETPAAYEAAQRHTRAHVILAAPGHWLHDLQGIEEEWRKEDRLLVRNPTILFTGRLIRGKNIHHLIYVFTRIADDFPHWKVDIIGPATDQEYALSLQEQTRQFGLEHRVRFLPAMTGSELFYSYRTSSIYCFPSQSEGFPSTILEAMYFGGAIVASHVGSISYQLDEGRCGLLCPPGDLNALEEHLIHLMSSETIRQRLIASARERCIERFVWDAHFPHILQAFENAFDEAMAGK